MGAGTSVGVPVAVSAVGKGVSALLNGISKPLAARLASPFTGIGGLGGGGPVSKGPSNIIVQRDNGTIKLPSSPEARRQLSLGPVTEAAGAAPMARPGASPAPTFRVPAVGKSAKAAAKDAPCGQRETEVHNREWQCRCKR